MGLLDWLFGTPRGACAGDARRDEALAQLIDAVDPRLRLVGTARERLCPAVATALDYADGVAASLAPCVDTRPAAWAASPVLRAFFVRPADVAETLATSQDLQDFLASPVAIDVAQVYCVIAATRSEQTVLGPALDGDILRQDVQQTAVSFRHFRLFAFSASDGAMRRRVADIVLEGLVLAALRRVAERQQEGERLAFAQRLLAGRLQLIEQSRAGLDALEPDSWRGRDIDSLRARLAANSAELHALEAAGNGLEATVDTVVQTLADAATLIRAEPLCLHLDAMNIVVPPEHAGARAVPLLEFSTATPGTSRRVAFCATFPRSAVAERRMDWDAGMRML